MSIFSTPSSTGLVDALNGRPVRRHTETGAFYVPKAGWPHFWGRTLDAIVVVTVAGILMGVLNSLVQNFALGSLSYSLMSSTGLYAIVLAAIWFLVLFVYGLICGTVGGVGDAASGMRGVRISDGTTAGALLGGWRAVCWSFAPLYMVMAIAVAVSGGNGDSFEAKFTAVDLRSGLAKGMEPVPDPKATAKAQQERDAQEQLPKLYGNNDGLRG